MNMFERTILATSGQLAKAAISLALFLAGVLLTIVGSLGSASSSAEIQFDLAVAGIFVALGAGTFAVTSIRCQKCGARWVWVALGKSHSSSWMATLLCRDKCPRCDWNGK